MTAEQGLSPLVCEAHRVPQVWVSWPLHVTRSEIMVHLSASLWLLTHPHTCLTITHTHTPHTHNLTHSSLTHSHTHTHTHTHTYSSPSHTQTQTQTQSLQEHTHRKHGDPVAVLTHQARGACGNSPESQLRSVAGASTHWEPLGP